MRRFPLTAVAAALALSCFDPASADDDGRRVARSDHEEQYRDGNCRVKRKWEKDGDFKEEIECKGARRGPTVFYARPDQRAWIDPGRAPVLVPRGNGLFLQQRAPRQRARRRRGRAARKPDRPG